MASHHDAPSAQNMQATHIIKVYVDATVVGENKISDCISSLYGMRIIVKSVQEPWILGRDELA